MNAEEMRIAIAEKVGGFKWYSFWERDIDESFPRVAGIGKDKGDFNYLSNNGQWSGAELPNYPADLNAMHEVEKALNEDQRDEYWCLLRHSVSAGLDDMQHCFNTAHATAAQRCEAFCRVFWPERFKE